MIASLCYDGSPSSNVALDFVSLLHQKSFFQSLITCYIYDHRKTYLPLQYQVQDIQRTLTQKFSSSQNVQMYVKPIQEGKSLSDELLMAQYHHMCNLMIFGFVGRKGEKSHLGEITPKIRKFVYESKLPLLIIKLNAAKESSLPLKICYTYDGSRSSNEGLSTLVDKLTANNVKLTIVYIGSRDESKEPLIVRNNLREFKSSNKQRLEIEVKVIENSPSPREALVEYLNQTMPDMTVITRNGCRGEITGKEFVGETATWVLTRANTNVWIIK